MDETWEEMYQAAKMVQHDRKISEYVEAGGVAAAVRTRSGTIYTGVCIDTCSTLGICAERNAIFHMITSGEHEMEKVLFAVDELTGLVGAAARMRPSRSVMDMEVSSLKKKFKDKKFAAGCSRDVIREGAENLGWTLEELMEKTILAMRSCEESVNKEMEN